MSRIGEAIRQTRRERDLTLEQIARPAGMSIAYLSDIERGARLPPHGTLLRIANQFPDVDSIAWVWLLTSDLFGEATVEIMQKHAAAMAQVEPR